MLRSAVVAVALVTAVSLTAPAADTDLSGSWLLSYTGRGGVSESNVCIVKIDTKDGKPTAKVVAMPPKAVAAKVKDFTISGKAVTLTLGNGTTFTGVLGGDAKEVRGAYGNDQVQFRAKLARTDQDAIESGFVKGNPHPAFAKAQQAAARPNALRFQAAREKDAEKKKELLAQVESAQKEADEQAPGLYREAASAADNPAAGDAALLILQSAAKWKVTAGEAKKLVALIEKQAASHGPAYTRFVLTEAAEALAAQKELAAVAADVLKPVVAAMAETEPAAAQVRVLTAYKAALEAAGQAADAKTIDARLVKLEAKLDAEYLAAVPPFKPAAFAGRKDKAATRVAVMELFTGAQCPPCVAADVAFDALAKSYKPGDLVLIQYHMHIPGPDPMTNPATVARWDYYREEFPEGIRGTPSTLFNGKPQAGGGGAMANSESKFDQYRGIIDPLLEQTTPVKLGGKATRSGDTVSISVEADGLEPADDLKLRLLVVEDTVKYVGGNKLRFHHHVVRAMPGGAAGVAVKDKAMKHTATVDVANVRTELTKYLNDFAASRPFPSPNRPLDMKALKVIALVQNDKTREIVQAVQIEVEGKVEGGN